jgi:excisionase family DNA binding protein
MRSHRLHATEDVLAPLLSLNEVARLLHVSRPTVYGLVRGGHLQPIRVGERLRFEQANVRAYLERNRDGHAP